MTASVVELRPRIPSSSRNGLWSALVAQIDPRSAAGSRLAGPHGPGQPFPAPVDAPADNVVAMFSRRPTDRGPAPSSAA